MIVLPFPPASLSGHNTGNKFVRAKIIATHRAEAFHAVRDAKIKHLIPAEGDIRVHVRFVPGDRRGDRCNFPNRMKPYLDGIAEALGVNDARFLPSYDFFPPVKPGRVEVWIAPPHKLPKLCDCLIFTVCSDNESGPEGCVNTRPVLTKTPDKEVHNGS